MNRPTARFLNASVLSQWAAPVHVAGSRQRAPGRLRRVGARLHANYTWKRTLDIGVSLLGLAVCLPAMGIAAAMIKLTSPGPVFFKQERIGLNRRLRNRRNGHNLRPQLERRNGDRRNGSKHGKPFTMYKFRSMRVDAEDEQPEWAVEGDPRITPIGRLLRKTRLDETPQFFNVLRGDMSVVGPRPERDFFYGKLSQDVPEFTLRLRAKPGITGLAQVENGYTNSVAGARQKLEHDLRYIDSLGPATDARILLRTVFVVLSGKGAY